MKQILIIFAVVLFTINYSQGNPTRDEREVEKRGLIGSTAGLVGTGLGLIGNGIWTTIGGIGTGLGTGFSLIGTGLKTGTSAIGSTLDLASSAIDKTSEALGTAGNAALNGASELATGIGQAGKNVGDIIGKEASDAVSQTVEGIKTGAGIPPPPAHWWSG